MWAAGPGARAAAGTFTAGRPPSTSGFDHVHVTVDDHTWLAYAEVLPDEKTGTLRQLPHPCGGLVRYSWRSRPPVADRQPHELLIRQGYDRRLQPARDRPAIHSPVDPGPMARAERLNATLQTEWAALSHSALGGQTADQPTRRLANLSGHDIG